MDYLTFKLLAAQDPRGRAAVEKWLATASPEQIAVVVDVINSPPAKYQTEEFHEALKNLAVVLKENGYM